MTTRVEAVDDVRAAVRRRRADGQRIGLVPTMGALHEGHLSLVDAARAACDTVVVSIFVNPLQFGPDEDFDAYPRDLARDLDLLEAAGADLVWTPAAAAFTPPGRLTTVGVAELTEQLEGRSRPGHFDGVTTIVAKLFNAVEPDAAFFGEKDYQQLVVVRRMALDLDHGVEVAGCPIVRSADGLALSSRNAYLSERQRRQALVLSRSLHELAAAWDGDASEARRWLRTTLGAAPGVDVDYAEVCDPATLAPLQGVVPGPARALVAAHVGPARLIDNVHLPARGACP